MLTKTFKILQTLCAVYGWEVVNNHGLSSKSVDNPVTQASLPAERFLDWNTLVTPRRFINWSPKLTPFQREVVGDSPLYNVRRAGEKRSAVRQADSGFGGRCTSRSSEAPLRPDSPLPVWPLNLMTFATGGTPRAGSWHHSTEKQSQEQSS